MPYNASVTESPMPNAIAIPSPFAGFFSFAASGTMIKASGSVHGKNIIERPAAKDKSVLTALSL